jgi:hypothetical protein
VPTSRQDAKSIANQAPAVASWLALLTGRLIRGYNLPIYLHQLFNQRLSVTKRRQLKAADQVAALQKDMNDIQSSSIHSGVQLASASRRTLGPSRAICPCFHAGASNPSGSARAPIISCLPGLQRQALALACTVSVWTVSCLADAACTRICLLSMHSGFCGKFKPPWQMLLQRLEGTRLLLRHIPAVPVSAPSNHFHAYSKLP